MKAIQEVTADIEKTCRLTGEYILAQRKKVRTGDVETKSLNSLVSFVDKQAEKMLVDDLRKIVPEAGFITEEDTPDDPDKRYRWVIDPLDGTTNFLHGIPVFAISVALMEDEKVLAGVIYELGQKEMFSACLGGGAFLDGQAISVNSNKTLKDTLLATGFPYHDFDRMGPFMDLLTELFKKTRGVRRLGSAATDLAYVACGRFDGFFEYGLSPWDVAAGVLIVKEAGGEVMDFTRGTDYIFGDEIVAFCPSIGEEFMEMVSGHLAAKS